MKLLVLSQYYPPEPIPKPHELPRGLAERTLYPGTRLQHLPAFREFQKGGIAGDMGGVSERLAHLTQPSFENSRKSDNAGNVTPGLTRAPGSKSISRPPHFRISRIPEARDVDGNGGRLPYLVPLMLPLFENSGTSHVSRIPESRDTDGRGSRLS